MKKKKTVILLMMVLVIVLAMPMQAYAASNPYRDVTRKTVDSDSYNAIVYVKKHGGFSGIASRRFRPSKKITRREFIMILHNLYGDKVTCTMSDLRNANGQITSSFACNRMVELSKKLGYPIKWSGNSSTLRRMDAARYVRIFATFNRRFAPRK